MNRFERWTIHLSTLAVGVTGLVYAAMLYLLPPVDEFSVVHHPLQGTVQHLHVLAAPLFVFAVGLLFRDHVWWGVRSRGRERRRSGLTLFASLVPMIASGYLLQTAVDETWRRAWIVVHLVASGLWIAGYCAHGLSRMWASRPPAR